MVLLISLTCNSLLPNLDEQTLFVKDIPFHDKYHCTFLSALNNLLPVETRQCIDHFINTELDTRVLII